MKIAALQNYRGRNPNSYFRDLPPCGYGATAYQVPAAQSQAEVRRVERISPRISPDFDMRLADSGNA